MGNLPLLPFSGGRGVEMATKYYSETTYDYPVPSSEKDAEEINKKIEAFKPKEVTMGYRGGFYVCNDPKFVQGVCTNCQGTKGMH